MRRFIVLFFLMILSLSSFSQKNDCDTIIRYDSYTGEEIKFKVTDWNMQIAVGATSYFYDYKTLAYLYNHWGPNFKLMYYYKNILFGGDFRPATLNVRRDLVFSNDNLTSDANLNVIKTDIFLGYNLNLPMNLVSLLKLLSLKKLGTDKLSSNKAVYFLSAGFASLLSSGFT